MSQLNETPVFSTKSFSWRDGKEWFDTGVLLFKQVKNQWYLVCLLLVLMAALFANISQELATITVVFASPLITAFMMNCCQKVSEEQNWGMLWQPIVTKLNGFLVLGAISVVISILFQYIHTQVLETFDLPVVLTEEMVRNMSGKESLFRSLLNLLTQIPLALALAFSPALILFKNTLPTTAIKYSAMGVLKSWKAFVALVLLFLLLFFGIVLFASLLMSIIHAVMGSVSQLLMSIIVLFFVITAGGIGLGAQYRAFTDVFANDENSDNGENEDKNGTEIYTEI